MPDQEGIFQCSIPFLTLMFGFEDVRVTDVMADYEKQHLRFRMIPTGPNPRWFGGPLELFPTVEGDPLVWCANVFTAAEGVTVASNFERIRPSLTHV